MKCGRVFPLFGLVTICMSLGSCGSSHAGPTSPAPVQLKITTLSLVDGTQNGAYNATLKASGGTLPLRWSVTAGSLPSGLTLSDTGMLAGSPGNCGSFTFTVQVTDSSSVPQVDTATFVLNIRDALGIATTTLPPGTVGSPYHFVLGVSGGAAPYTWSVIAGTLPQGLQVSTVGDISGTPTDAGDSTITVQVVDSYSAAVTAVLNIHINALGDTQVLKGNYAFLVSGFGSDQARWIVAGSLVADGEGNITSGVVDRNALMSQPINVPVTGTYSVATGNVATLSLTSSGASYSATFAFALSANSDGRIIEYDDSTGFGSRGSGILRKQDPNAFQISNIAGSYVFGITGSDSSGFRAAIVGQFILDESGNIKEGVCDINDGGSPGSCYFSGAVSLVDSTTGRTLSSMQGESGFTQQALYIISSSELLMISIDSVQDTGALLMGGSILRQSNPGNFSNGSLDGAAILYDQALVQDFSDPNTSQASVGLLSFDHGSFTMTDDENRGGIETQHSISGEFTVASNGRAVSTEGGPIVYLISQNQGTFLGTDVSVTFGTLETQSAGPFASASVSGTYAGGSLVPAEAAVVDDIALLFADGGGNAGFNVSSSGPSGLKNGLVGTVSYTVATTGRGRFTNAESDLNGIIYVISPTRFVVLPAEQNGGILVFEH